MARLTVSMVAFWHLAGARALPPGSLESLAIGAIQGFISDSPDVMTCGMAAISVGTDVKEAAHDLKKGIMTMNLTDIDHGLDEAIAAIEAGKATKATCDVVVKDVKAIQAKIRQIHGPKDLVKQMVENLFGDGDKIFAELAAAEHSYKSGWDYMTAGQQLGMALRRTLVGELNGTKPGPPMPHNSWEQVAVGLAQGFISDGPDFMECGMGMMGEGIHLQHALQDIKKGIQGMNKSYVEEAVHELDAAVNGSAAAKAKCKKLGADAKKIIGQLKKIHGPKDLVIHIVSNLFDDGEKIFGELAAAESAYKTGWDYMTAGTQLGMAFRRMLVGESNTTMTTSPEAAVIV